MPGLRHLAVTVLLLAIGCQETPKAGPAADDATIERRVVDYFHKTVTQPGLAFEVTKLEDSELPGWRKGTLKVSQGQQSQDVPFQVTRDGHYMYRGDVVDLTMDPVQEVVKKLKLDGAPSRGPAGARVTIVEYADFQCPFCGRAYQTIENQVLKEYGDRVRFVFKNFPLTAIHPWAEDAAIASRCAYQQDHDKFWPVYRGLFEKQGTITRDNFQATATALATDAGLDATQFGACLDGKATLDAVKADQVEATSLSVNSTPTFFVNGRRLTGAQTYDSFKQMIEQELGGKS